METSTELKAMQKRHLCKKCAAHIPTAANDTATLTLSNSPTLDSPTATCPDMDNSVHSATLSTSKNITSAPLQLLWNSLSNVCQEAENYLHKQQLHTAPITTPHI